MSDEQNTDPRAPAQPMTDERLTELVAALPYGLDADAQDELLDEVFRLREAGLATVRTLTERADVASLSILDTIAELLADRDRLAAEVVRLTEQLDIRRGWLMSAPTVVCSDRGRVEPCAEPVEMYCYDYGRSCSRKVSYRPGAGPGHREIYCERHGRQAWPPQFRDACPSPELDR